MDLIFVYIVVGLVASFALGLYMGHERGYDKGIRENIQLKFFENVGKKNDEGEWK